MRAIISAAVAALALCAPAAAQNIRISDLPVAATLTGSEKVPVVQSGRTVAATPQQVITLAGQTFQPLDTDLSAIAALATQPTGRDLLTAATPQAIRDKAALGTIATQNANLVAITGGTITGITDLAIADGGTGAGTAAAARTNLGLGSAATSNIGTSGATVPLLSTANTWTLAQTMTVPLTVASGGTGANAAAGARTNLGLGTAAVANTGTSGATVPLLNNANTWSSAQTFSTPLAVASGGTGRNSLVPVLSMSRSGSGSFTTVGNTFTTLVLTTVTLDSATGYNTSTGIYTLPETGLYLITAKMRLVDNTVSGINYGLGIDTANQDSPSFFWNTTPNAPNSAAARHGIFNSRLYSGTAGDQLRLFAYVDAGAAQGIQSAELNIIRLR